MTWLPYLQWPYLWESGQVFQATERIKVLKQECSQSAINGAHKKVKELSLSLFALITNPKNEYGCSAQGYSSCNAHWAYKIYYLSLWYKITILVVCIKPTKAVTSFRINIKPTRPTISILRAHQVYRVSQDHQKAAAYLTAW